MVSSDHPAVSALSSGRSCLAGLAMVLLASPLVSQLTWTQKARAISPPPRLTPAAAALDSVRGRLVLFGGGTWEWDGSAWIERFPVHSPPGDGTMAYDAVHSRAVLFGPGTWEWDGTDWIERLPANAPVAGGPMVYDALRGHVLLFNNSETWTWDGANWTQRFPLHSPSGSTRADMAYDVARDRTVLFIERSTWEWDGVDWQQRTPAHVPGTVSHHAMTYDATRQRVLLFGGMVPTMGVEATNETWEWDGVDWTQRSPMNLPTARMGHVLVFDPLRGRSVLFGGWYYLNGPGGIASDPLGDTWEWNGANWVVRTPGGMPSRRADHVLAFDRMRGRTVLFGGYDGGQASDTWEWDGSAWSQRATPVAPPGRHGSAMVYDSNRHQLVLFGGKGVLVYRGEVNLGDTWVWDGAAWSEPTTGAAPCSIGTTPRARGWHAMAYDSARDRVVLFGGNVTTYPCYAVLSDTWEWDGSAWTERSPVTTPPPSIHHAMSYDSVRRRTVLLLNDGQTWEWDGTDWTQRAPAHAPSGAGAMTFDTVRGLTVFCDGTMTTWEWDGVDWRQRTPTSAPGPRGGHAIDFDSVRQRLVLFGGAGDYLVGDTWECTVNYRAGSYTPYGTACIGTGGVTPFMDAEGRSPWIGEDFTVFVSVSKQTPIVFLWLGASRALWGSLPLPYDLTATGMPGCWLYASIDWVFAVSHQQGIGNCTFPIPNDLSLLGATFYNQALVPDPNANQFGAVVSNGGAGVIGIR